MRRPQLALLLLIVLLVVGYTATALRGHDSSSATIRTPITSLGTSPGRTASPAGSGDVALSALPPQAAQTVALIERGGPFPYRQDGVVFANAERHLPRETGGYYHEYTVRTPDSPDRGARRIITGRGGEYWYTADHYDSFVRVDVSR